MMIIDPPVSAASPIDQIEAWIAELHTWDQQEPAVQRALQEADYYREQARTFAAALAAQAGRRDKGV
jgi:hypothetical protein